MHTIQEDYSPSSLVDVIILNQFEWLRYIASSPNATLWESSQLICFATQVPMPLLNGVLRINAASQYEDQVIEEAKSLLSSQGVTISFWWTKPGSSPPDIGDHLTRHGLTYNEGLPGMAADLAVLNEDVKTPPDFSMRRVQDVSALQEWSDTLIDAYEMPQAWAEPAFDLFHDLGFGQPLRHYTGYLKEKPVATSQLFLAAGVAGIYSVGTIPQARKQGIGSAVTLAPLIEAREMGYRIGVLGSTPVGYGVYKRLGFQEYCKLGNYVWSVET